MCHIKLFMYMEYHVHGLLTLSMAFRVFDVQTASCSGRFLPPSSYAIPNGRSFLGSEAMKCITLNCLCGTSFIHSAKSRRLTKIRESGERFARIHLKKNVYGQLPLLIYVFSFLVSANCQASFGSLT